MFKLRSITALVAAAFVVHLAIAAIALRAHAQGTDVPRALRESAECMYEILKATPGVSEPKLGYETTGGWTHPFLEYRAAEFNSWVQPTRFEAIRGDDNKYRFFASLPGIISPKIGHLDIHVTESVAKKWRTQCNVELVIVTN